MYSLRTDLTMVKMNVSNKSDPSRNVFATSKRTRYVFTLLFSLSERDGIVKLFNLNSRF